MIKITSQPFGRTADGAAVKKYILTNQSGMSVAVTELGCAIQSVTVPDKDGVPRDVALGYDSAEFYERGSSYLGAFIGRCANRIKGARFTLNGIEYRLKQNEGKNHIHGAFARRVFGSEMRGDAVAFPFVSLPGEEGYPGVLTGEALYRLTEDNSLEIEYTATADEDTVVNLTNHTYFNLNGHDGSNVLDHTLRLACDSFTETDDEQIPTGRVLRVDDTPFDFRRGKEIGADIFCDHPQLRLASGYDHNMIVSGESGQLRFAAQASSPKTGITLTALTTEPGVQLYTGNFLQDDAAPFGKGRVRYPRFGGFCLEAQGYPDAVNRPDFPDAVLRKGEVYRQKTVYRFSSDARS